MFSKGLKRKQVITNLIVFFSKSFKLGMFDYVYAKELILGRVAAFNKLQEFW